MRKALLKYAMILLATLSLASLCACGNDEPTPTDTTEDTTTGQTDTDNGTNSGSSNNDDADEYKFQIVGTWKAVYEWVYSGSVETVILEIYSDCTYAFVTTSTNNPEPFTGTGDWTYDKQTHTWKLGPSTYSFIPGNYSLINGQLILYKSYNDGSSRTVIYNRMD